MPSADVDFVILGDSGVGKTVLVDALGKSAREDKDCGSDKEAVPTIGIDFVKISLGSEGDGQISLNLLDTSGSMRFVAIIESCLKKDLQSVFLVYDISADDGLEKAEYIYNIFQNKIQDNVAIILLGNKSDIEGKRITTEAAEQFAAKHGFAFAGEVSARAGHGVFRLLQQHMAKACVELKQKHERPSILSGWNPLAWLWRLLCCCIPCYPRSKENSDSSSAVIESTTFVNSCRDQAGTIIVDGDSVTIAEPNVVTPSATMVTNLKDARQQHTLEQGDSGLGNVKDGVSDVVQDYKGHKGVKVFH